MKKVFFSFLFTVISLYSSSNSVMPRVPSHLFINGGETDFSALFQSDNQLKNKVQMLFNGDKLNHEFSKAYDVNASFTIYWKKNKDFWHSLDLNKDGVNELIYLSIISEINTNESFEIYSLKNKKYEPLYIESGHLIAFKIHPKTSEIILFQHKYPCCSSLSHNINMVRYIRKKIVLRKKYFIAADKDLGRSFFPKKIKYSSNYFYLNKQTKLRWSPELYQKNTIGTFIKNVIAEYPKKTAYRILSKEKGWNYVLMCGVPSKMKRNAGILNSDNFKDIHVYGWIKD